MPSFPIEFFFVWLGLIVLFLVAENATQRGIFLIIAGLISVPFGATVFTLGVQLNKTNSVTIEDLNSSAQRVTFNYETQTWADSPLLFLIYLMTAGLSLLLLFGGIYRVYKGMR